MKTDKSVVKTDSFLTFKLADETFGANVSKVLSILELSPITKVPKAPDYMVGVINLRGAVLPVVDTRVKFQMEAFKATPNTCILVLEIKIDEDTINVGAIVDSVQEVLELQPSQIRPAPSIGSRYRSDFIEGIAHTENGFIMLLNMDMIFSSTDISILASTAETADKAEIEEIQ